VPKPCERCSKKVLRRSRCKHCRSLLCGACLKTHRALHLQGLDLT